MQDILHLIDMRGYWIASLAIIGLCLNIYMDYLSYTIRKELEQELQELSDEKTTALP